MCITSGAVIEKKENEERAKKQKNNDAQNKCLLDTKSVKEIYKQGGGGKWWADETSYYVCSTGNWM